MMTGTQAREFFVANKFVAALLMPREEMWLITKPDDQDIYEFLTERIVRLDCIQLSLIPPIDVWVDDEGSFRPESEYNLGLHELVARMLDVDLDEVPPLRGPGIVTRFDEKGDTRSLVPLDLLLLGLYGLSDG